MRKIIVVDPDKKFWKDVEKVVNTDICEVVFLENGQSLMGKLKNEQFDLIILNLELPDKNGFIFCNQIKKDNNLKEIPIIITSSEKSENDFAQHKKLKVRAQDYLKKPVSLIKLKNSVKSFLPDVILENDKGKKNRKEEQTLKVDDFDEENIDKLLDETFIGLIEKEPQNETQPESPQEPSQLQKQLDDLLEENMALKQQIEELQQGNSAEKMLKEENQKLREEIEKLQKESITKQTLTEENENLKKEISQLKGKVSELEKENAIGDKVAKENYKLKNELEELKKQINELEKENAIGDKVAKENYQLKNELENLKKEKENLEQKLNEKKEEIKEINVQLIAVQKEKGFLEKENREHLMTITSLKADFEEKLQEMEGRINALQTEKENLFKQLIVAKNEIQEKDKFIASLQEELSRQKTEASTLREKLSDAENRLEQLREFKAHSEKQLIEQNQLISNLQKDLNISREAKSALEETVYDLKEEVKTMQMEIEKKNKEYQMVRDQLKEAQIEVEKKDNENRMISNQLKKAEEKIRNYQEKLEKIKEIIS